LSEARAAGLKSLVDHQQSAQYCHQLPSRLCGNHVQQLLLRTDRLVPNLLAYPFQGKSALPIIRSSSLFNFIVYFIFSLSIKQSSLFKLIVTATTTGLLSLSKKAIILYKKFRPSTRDLYPVQIAIRTIF
jgi:hypothetical protein